MGMQVTQWSDTASISAADRAGLGTDVSCLASTHGGKPHAPWWTWLVALQFSCVCREFRKRDWRSLECCPQEIVLVGGEGWTKQDDQQRGDSGG